MGIREHAGYSGSVIIFLLNNSYTCMLCALIPSQTALKFSGSHFLAISQPVLNMELVGPCLSVTINVSSYRCPYNQEDL